MKENEFTDQGYEKNMRTTGKMSAKNKNEKTATNVTVTSLAHGAERKNLRLTACLLLAFLPLSFLPFAVLTLAFVPLAFFPFLELVQNPPGQHPFGPSDFLLFLG